MFVKLAALATISIGLASSQALARDLAPDNFGEQPLVLAAGSQTVLLPKTPWHELMWRLRYDNNVSEPGIGFESFDIRVVKDDAGPNAPTMVNVSFDSQSSFSNSPACSGYPTARAVLYSKAGDIIDPSPMQFTANVEKHEANKHWAFTFGPIQNYPFDQIGKVAITGLTIAADCGD